MSTGVHWATASLFGIWNNQWLWNEVTLAPSCCLRGSWIASCQCNRVDIWRHTVLLWIISAFVQLSAFCDWVCSLILSSFCFDRLLPSLRWTAVLKMHTLQWPTTPGHRWHPTTPTTTALLTCLPTLLMTFRWVTLQAVSLFSSKVKSRQSAGLWGPVFLSFTQFNFLVPAENTKFFLLGIGPWQCSLLLRHCFPESCPWSEGKREDLLPACLPITH